MRNWLCFGLPRPTITLDSDLRSYRSGGSRYVQRKEWRINSRSIVALTLTAIDKAAPWDDR